MLRRDRTRACSLSWLGALAAIASFLMLSRHTAHADDTVLHLPALGTVSEGDVCTTAIRIHNPSTQPAIAATLFWGNPSFCAPQSYGPLSVACSTLIGPGQDWLMPSAFLPEGAKSATILSFNGAPGALQLPSGDSLCDALFFGVIGDSADARQLLLSYHAGDDVYELPASSYQGPALAATVERECGNGRSPYSAVSHGEATDTYRLDGLRRGGRSGTHVLHIQNVGPLCAMVEFMFSDGSGCAIPALPSGEAFPLDVASCSAVSEDNVDVDIHSNQPLAVHSEIYDDLPEHLPAPRVPADVMLDTPPAAAPFVRLPVVTQLMEEEAACDATVQVNAPSDNDGPTMAVMIALGNRSFSCGSAGPQAVECSGLIRPGGRWFFTGRSLPSGTHSADVYSVRTEPMDELDGIPGAVLCNALHYGIVGDADDYRRFIVAQATGGRFGAVPLARAAGPPISVAVRRDCPEHGQSSRYGGLTEAQWSALQPDGSFSLTLEALQGGADGTTSYLYIQNAGEWCAGIDVSFSSGHSCSIPALAPGKTYALDVASCTAASVGDVDAVISSAVPLAIVAERYAFAIEHPDPPPVPEPVSVDPPPSADTTVFLPLMTQLQNDDQCEALLHVRNPSASAESALAVLLLHGGHRYCTPQAAGPLSIRCSGLIRPGGSWFFEERFAHSGRLVSLTTRRLSEIGVAIGEDGQPSDEIVGAALCESLFWSLMGDADDMRRFAVALETGAPWAGIPLDRATGPPLEVALRRTCDMETHSITRTHAGLSRGERSAPLGEGHYQAVVSDLHASAERTSLLYLQNAGRLCTALTVELDSGERCTVQSLPAEESVTLDLASCADRSPSARQATITSSSPLAILSETYDEALEHPELPLDPELPAVDPPATPSRLSYLPILGTDDTTLDCRPVIRIESPEDASESAMAVVLAWGDPSPCGPGTGGPDTVECSGLIAPGGSWAMYAPQTSSWMRGAELYSFRTGPLQDIAPSKDEEDLIGAYLCEVLFFTAISDIDDHRRFKLAYLEGTTYSGVPLDQAAGPPLATSVARRCDALGNGTYEMVYAAVPADALSERQANGRFEAQRSGLHSELAEGTVQLFLQNAGAFCTDIELRFDNGESCSIPALAPSATYILDVESCAGELTAPVSVTMESGQPLAVAAAAYDFPTTSSPLPSAPRHIPPERPRAAATTSYLPVISSVGRADVCDPVIRVANPSDSGAPAVAILPVWSEVNYCNPEPGGAGEHPLWGFLGASDMLCSGLIAPGGAWQFPTERVNDIREHARAYSAMSFSLSTERLSEIGAEIEDGGEDDIIGSYLCETVFFRTIGNPPRFVDFKDAYERGAAYEGIPLDRARGPALEVSITRRCAQEEFTHERAYGALGPEDLSQPLRPGQYELLLDDVVGGAQGRTSILYLQNAGNAATTPDVRFGAERRHVAEQTGCDLVQLEPGASVALNVGACIDEAYTGSVRISSEQPLAVLHETYAQPLPAARTLKDVWVDVRTTGDLGVRWRTGDESTLRGFNVYRSEDEEGERTKLNTDLIPPRAPSGVGACYAWRDWPGSGTFYYVLELVYLDDRTERTEPLRARADDLMIYLPLAKREAMH